jgi:hypothetical protein
LHAEEERCIVNPSAAVESMPPSIQTNLLGAVQKGLGHDQRSAIHRVFDQLKSGLLVLDGLGFCLKLASFLPSDQTVRRRAVEVFASAQWQDYVHP